MQDSKTTNNAAPSSDAASGSTEGGALLAAISSLMPYLTAAIHEVADGRIPGLYKLCAPGVPRMSSSARRCPPPGAAAST